MPPLITPHGGDQIGSSLSFMLCRGGALIFFLSQLQLSCLSDGLHNKGLGCREQHEIQFCPKNADLA